MIQRVRGVALLLPLLAGCSTMSPATPKLSAELGDRIAEMRGLHQLALESYFESERRRIEAFIDEQWTPLFLRNFLGTSGILSDLASYAAPGKENREELERVVASYLDDPAEAPSLTADIVAVLPDAGAADLPAIRRVVARYVEDDRVDAAVVRVTSLLGVGDPGELILEWAEDAQAEINARRRAMLRPLDEAERRTNAQVAEAYAEMLKANGVVTARLEAAAEVSAEHDALFEAFGVDEVTERVRSEMAALSARVGDAVAAAERALATGRDHGGVAGALIGSLSGRSDEGGS